MNQPPKSLWFDLETTGLGKGKPGQGIFVKPVSIWQLGYSIENEVGSVYANINVPFEQQVLNKVYKNLAPFKGKENAVPKVYAEAANKVSEEQLVKKFGELIKKHPKAILSGYNIRNYDIPLMVKKFQQYGLKEELGILREMQTNDTFNNAQAFLDQVIPNQFKSALGLKPGDDLMSGMKLEVLAKAFNIDVSQFDGHLAHNDAKLTSQIQEILNDPKEAAKRYDLLSHAKAQDAAKIKAGEPGSWVNAYNKMRRNNPNLEKTLDVSIPNDYITVGKLTSVDTNMFTDVKDAMRASKPLKQEAADVINAGAKNIGKGFDEAIKSSKKILTPGVIKAGAIAAGAVALYKVVNSIMDRSKDRSDYISATSLGKNKEDSLKALSNSKNIKDFNRIGANAEADIGTKLHAIIEEEFTDKGFAYDTETSVYDDELKVQGRIDVLGKINGKKIPIEIKTVSNEELESKTEPTYEHASQANFYAHATNSSSSYVFYVSKTDTKNRKAFYVPYSPERLIRDVADLRSLAIESRSNPDLQKWGMQMEDYFGQSTVPPAQPEYDINAVTSRSKISDQSSKYGHLYPIGTINNGNNTKNASRYDRRN